MAKIIKLPRKKKKQFIKARSRADYFSAQVIEKVLLDTKVNHKPRFVKKFTIDKGKMIIHEYW